MQIPIGNVAAWMPKQISAVDKQGREVHPLLVREEALVDVRLAHCVKVTVPPVEQLATARRIGQGSEAEVVYSCLQDRQIRGDAPVIRQR